MKNKQYVDMIMANMEDRDREQIAEISVMRVIDFFLLPGREVDKLTRIFRRAVTLNRGTYLKMLQDAINEGAMSPDGGEPVAPETEAEHAHSDEHVHDDSEE